MISSRARLRLSLVAGLWASMLGCDSRLPSTPAASPGAAEGGKADVFGRSLIGRPAPYPAARLDADSLRNSMRARRAAAWETARKVLEPVPLVGLTSMLAEVEQDGGPQSPQVPQIPRFQTWYGIEDIKRLFRLLYEDLSPQEREARSAFSGNVIEAALEQLGDEVWRSPRWSLERYLDYVSDLLTCPPEVPAEECQRQALANVAGSANGITRIMYSESTVIHILRNYAATLSCLSTLTDLSIDATPPDEENFTHCFSSEFPNDAALIKTQWVRGDTGLPFPAFDTSGNAMQRRLAGTADWGVAGERRVQPDSTAYTIRLRDGSTYRLAGLHIMTKELRHWQWVTLWWSDAPDLDFGADRPATFRSGVGPEWRHYKMCTVVDFLESARNPVDEYAELPSLADALRAVGAESGRPTWCSNPYLEHGENNARTNCIGCHQHAGSLVAFDEDGSGTLDSFVLSHVLSREHRYPQAGRLQIREIFPSDYLYSFDQFDAFSRVIRGEVEYYDAVDGRWQ